MLRKFLDIISHIKQVKHIGLADIVGNGIAALFWFFIARLVGVEEFMLESIQGICPKDARKGDNSY